MDLNALRTEITNDPASLGYAGKTDAQVATLMNAVNQTANVATIDANQLIRAIQPADFSALTQIQLSRLSIILGAEPFSVNDVNIKQMLADLFAGKTQTLAALQALQTYQTSRALLLFGEPVTAGDVQRARALT
jgi:hypothetical protein